MAVVFRARDERLYRTVALKAMAPGLAGDDEFRERFIRESRAAAAVDHPHIIPVYGAGEADGILYIAMRFVSGGDLRSVLRREGPLPAERAAFLLSPIAWALDAAHAAGLVHRDVKPANILIDSAPTRLDHPYLSDFGLSKGTASITGITAAGQFLGTPDYSAPEQISGKPVNVQTDQYALGCVAFQALTGKAPFIRDQPMAVLLAHLNDPPPSVIAQRPDLSPAVDRVLSRALAKNPGDRFANCGEFASALTEALRERSDSHLVADLETVSIATPGAWAAPAQDITMASRAPVPLTTATGPAAPDSRARTGPAGFAPGAAAGRTTHGRRHAGPTRRARRSRVAAAAGVPVLLAAVIAGVVLLHQPATSHKPTVTSGHGGTLAKARTTGTHPPSAGSTHAQVIGTLAVPGGEQVDTVVFGPGGTLATVDGNRNGTGTANIYAFDIGTRARTVSRTTPELLVDGVGVTADGKTLVEPTGCQSGCGATVFDLTTGRQITTLPAVAGFENYSTGDSIFAASDPINDGMALWSLSSGVNAGTVTDPDHHFIVGSAISANGEALATSSDGGGSSSSTHTIYVWNTASQTVLMTLTVPSDYGFNNPMAFDRDGKVLAISNGTDTRIYDLATRRLVITVPAAMMALSPDGSLMVAATPGAGEATVWSISPGKKIATVPVHAASDNITSAAFSADDKDLAFGDDSGDVVVSSLPG